MEERQLTCDGREFAAGRVRDVSLPCVNNVEICLPAFRR